MANIQKQKITPYLWYEHQAQDAAAFYCTLFQNSKITSLSDIVVEFELDGIQFIALNGGPQYTFSEAVSFFVLCKDQAEVDYFWHAFTSEGGQESQCGWCKDKFGLSWQIVPQRFMQMMAEGSPEQVQRVVEVMMPMKKMIIAEFEKAYQS